MPQWLRDLGSVAGLLTLVYTVWKSCFGNRPYLIARPELQDGPKYWYLEVFNPGPLPILIRSSSIWPSNEFYVTERDGETREVILSLIRGGPGPSVVSAEKTIRLQFTIRNEAIPKWCLVVVRWQRLGGLPWLSFPLVFYRRRDDLMRMLKD